jgi:hypothetical protein
LRKTAQSAFPQVTIDRGLPPLFVYFESYPHRGGQVGVAYYIAFDDEDLKIDGTDGKSVARVMEDLASLSKELGVRDLESFMGQSMAELGDMLDEDIDLAGMDDGAAWFDPKDGALTINALIQAIRRDPRRFKNAEAVVEDLESYRDALASADKARAKWHLAVDI